MMQPENPFCDRAEFEKAFLASPEWQRLTEFAVATAYSSIQAQPVSNMPEGHAIISAIVAVRGGEQGGKMQFFHFALLTENGHVAQPEL